MQFVSKIFCAKLKFMQVYQSCTRYNNISIPYKVMVKFIRTVSTILKSLAAPTKISQMNRRNVHNYVGQNEEHYEAVMGLSFAPKSSRDNKKDIIQVKCEKFDVIVNTNFFYRKVVQTNQSCEDIKAVPRSDMLHELFGHVKAINENFVSNTSIHTATKWRDAEKSTEFNFIRFFWNCGFYGGTCPLKFTLTVPLHDVSKFYNSPEFVKCQIKLSGRTARALPSHSCIRIIRFKIQIREQL